MNVTSILKKMITTIVMCFLLTVVVYAAPQSFIPLTLTQPDNSTLECFASGDEFFNYLHDADEKLIMLHPETGYYVYAMLDSSSKLVASDNVAVTGGYFYRSSDKSQGLSVISSNGITVEDIDFSVNSHLISSKYDRPLPTESEQTSEEPQKDNLGVTRTNPPRGTMENIIVMICFSNESQTITSTVSNKINSVFNTSTLSLNSYIKTVSENALEIKSSLVGLYGGTTLMYKDSNPRGYYRPYSATNTIGYKTDTEATTREHNLLRNAIKAIDGSSLLAGKNLDIDGNGNVDSIAFIISGNVDGWNDLLWPHQWSIYTTPYAYLNGKRVNSYSFQLVDDLFPSGSESDLSVICHETLHTFSFPDLYRYSPATGAPVGAWDIMASNMASPQLPNTHTKLRYGGWGNQITEITGSGRYTLYPIGNTNGTTSYGIATSNSKEFILLEYRSYQNTSLYDKFYSNPPYNGTYYAPGLTITRINTSFSGNANRTGTGMDDEVYVFRPGETTKNLATGTSWGNVANASLSSNRSRTSFGSATAVSTYSGVIYQYSGTNTKIVISNVSSAGTTISFDVQMSGTQTNYTITATAGTGGTVIGGGSYSSGATATLTASPSAGYTFEGWYENNTKISNAAAVYSFTVTANRTLQARFVSAAKAVGSLDYPTNNLTVDNKLDVSGWYLYTKDGSNDDISNIELFVDDTSYGNAERFDRADIRTAIIGFPDYSKSGFAKTIDTTSLSNGNHTFTAMVRGTDNTTINTFTRTITVSHSLSGKPLLVALDTPQDNESVSNSFDVSGWVLYTLDGTTSEIGNVEISIGSKRVVAERFLRTDVQNAILGYGDYSKSGYFAKIDINDLSVGTYQLNINIMNKNNTAVLNTVTRTIQKTGIEVKGPIVMLDSPAESQNIANNVVIAGWALYTTDGSRNNIGRVEVSVGTQTVYASLFVREDVKNAIPGFGDYANSGFYANIDTSYTPSGNVPVVVKIFDSNNNLLTTLSRTITKGGNASKPFISILDTPQNSDTKETSVYIAGWALLTDDGITNNIGRVSAEIGGNWKELDLYVRPDLINALQGYGDYANSGFSGTIDISNLSSGTHTLSVYVYSRSGTLLFTHVRDIIKPGGDNGNANLISLGFLSSYYVKDNSLWAWGYNSYGLGNGTATSSTRPINVMDNISSVSAGYEHTMVIKKDGTLWGFGNNSSGQLGNGTETNSSTPVFVMSDVDSVMANESCTVALKKDGSLWVWGDAVSSGNIAANSLVPHKILDDVKSFSFTNYHIMVIKTDNTLWGWGYNGNGELGDGTYVSKTSQVKIMNDVASVSAGNNCTMIIKTDGTLWACGSNTDGKLGDGTEINRPNPVLIATDVKSVYTDYWHTMMVKKDGTLWAYGWNNSGQLGTGTKDSSAVPVKILDNVASARVSFNYSMALKNDGSIWTWGNNSLGQLGDGTGTESLVPKQISIGSSYPVSFESVIDVFDMNAQSAEYELDLKRFDDNNDRKLKQY